MEEMWAWRLGWSSMAISCLWKWCSLGMVITTQNWANSHMSMPAQAFSTTCRHGPTRTGRKGISYHRYYFMHYFMNKCITPHYFALPDSAVSLPPPYATQPTLSMRGCDFIPDHAKTCPVFKHPQTTHTFVFVFKFKLDES